MTFQRFKPVPPQWQRDQDADMAEGALQRQEADAALVEAAGCRCERSSVIRRREDPGTLFKEGPDGKPDPPGTLRVVYLPPHEGWCPIALAAKIRGQA